MDFPRGVGLGLVVGTLLFLSACATHRVATAPARPAPATTSPGPLAVGYEERGEASWYGNPYHGRRAASGEVYDMHQMTAAHRTLPFGTRIRVESLLDGSSVEVRINDRGPFKDADTRILDLSFAAGKLLGAIGPGVIPVRLRVVSLPRPPAAAVPAEATPIPPPPAAVSPPPAPAPPTVSAPPPAPVVVSAQAPVAPPAQVAPPIPAEPPAPRVGVATRTEPATATPPVPRAEPAPRGDLAGRANPAPRVEGWSVQLGAYSSEAPALTLRDSLARAWPEARVQRAEVAGRSMWRVRVGNYASRREADEAAKRLAASGYRVMVVEAGRP
jgi:peptidoglycan lytic transglycosylase